MSILHYTVRTATLCSYGYTHKMTCALLACNCNTFSPDVKFGHTKANFTHHVKLVTLLSWLRYSMILIFTKHITDLTTMTTLKMKIESCFH